MRIRLNPGAVGWFAAGLAHLLARTVRVVRELEDPRFDLRDPDHPRAIYAFWHGRILLAALAHIGSDVRIPISRHRDGEYVARMAGHLGVQAIRGSTRRGGARALKEMLRTLRDHDVAVTPDGPRGPRHVVQPGIIHLARLAQCPIVPGGLEVSSAWEAPSWDGFAVPLPFSRLAICAGRPIRVAHDADDRAVENVRRALEDDLRRLSARAREIVRGAP